MRDGFYDSWKRLVAVSYRHDGKDIRGRLAEIIVLDQFSAIFTGTVLSPGSRMAWRYCSRRKR
ncbi:hypothetical protein LZ023_39735 (plasmid) [Pseudomonas silvicola]|nr:hypothetical protein LZ023_39735 [Pseudomonas silvicola]